MNKRDSGAKQATAAATAGISVRTGSRIDTGTHQPQRGQPHDWLTRADPLEQVWLSELDPMLQREPRLEPMTLFEYLQETYPGKYEGVLRTMQRRVERWKASQGKPKEVMFKIRHEPGEMGLSDFTHLKGVTVTLQGQLFQHLLYHYRLAYSGWQYIQVIQGGESFVGLSQGLQNALAACGGVPQIHRTDSLSAAYRNVGGRNPKLTQMYSEVCSHYRLRPTHNNKGVAHENGSVESPHGHFKRKLCQALFRRGSLDFASVSEYQALIEQVVAKQNAKRTQKFEVEKALLQALPRYRSPDYEVLSVKVSCYSTINIRSIIYSVPSRLIGQRLTIHLYHDRLIGFVGRTEVLALVRVHIHGSEKIRRGRSINYRHLVESFRRKPRAFLHCDWQADVLPNEQWQQLWQQMKQLIESDTAARIMVEALYVAATQDKEAEVATYLAVQLAAQTLSLRQLQQAFDLIPNANTMTFIETTQHNLATYDQLLTSACEQPLPEPQRPPQTPPPQPDESPVATTRTASNSGALVLCAILAGIVRGGKPTARSSPPQPRVERGTTALWKVLFQL
ncbi:MAG: IS21 family transposase [Leptolyngbyaceae cyanobacterium CSU_1_4]|nr:IS21 family transposase [Leptolyngbyaceae cyanobacterium CSU_1_4]